jgi:hypothetical protein
MRVIDLDKTPQGVVIIRLGATRPNDKPLTALQRFWAFFVGVPIFGGHEWRTLAVEEIVAIFRQAAAEARQICQEQHDAAIREHQSQWWLSRWWKERQGWQAPAIMSDDEILGRMAEYCRQLSTKMRTGAMREALAGIDSSVFIEKPEAVAAQLTGS